MYIRQDHQLNELDAMYALVDAHALGAWVLQGEDGLVANHVPFLLERGKGPHGTLIGHVARANPVWQSLGAGSSSLVMFQGPQTYITPNWMSGKLDDGKVVPTWDYAVVHVHGVARAVEDPAWLMYMLARLTQAQEATQAAPWQVADAPPAYIGRLLRAIVGIEIRIDRFEGKRKASQDPGVRAHVGAIEALRGLQPA